MSKMPVVHWRRLIGWENIKTRPSLTSWLDGLRGVAALQVLFFHFSVQYTTYGHTYGSSDKDYYLHQLPLFRTIWAAGSGAVSTFFVISGYAITVKSFSLLRQRNYEDLFSGLCSSMLRRGFRLFLPVYLLAIPSFFIIHIFNVSAGFLIPYDAEKMSTWGGELVHFITTTDKHINPFVYRLDIWDNHYPFVPTAWTIPIEYYGSMVCYIVMMIIARMEIYRLRSLIVGGICLYAIHQGSWATSNFLFGMWMADSTLEQKTQAGQASNNNKTRKGLFTALFVLIFMFGAYLATMPPELLAFDMSPQPKVGYMWLYKFYPPKSLVNMPEEARWYWYLSGNLTFLGISQVPQLQMIFNTKFCQWLGKISFSIYLLHSLVIALISKPLQKIASTMTGHPTLVFIFDFSIIMPIMVVIASLMERFIDQPSVRFTKWLEQQLFKPQVVEPSVELSQRPFIVRDPDGNGRPAD